ncbi:MAG: hypothetical protein ABI887_01990 [Burkholderiales bacterium]
MKARIELAVLVVLSGAALAPLAAYAQPSSPHILYSPILNLTASESAAMEILAQSPMRQVEREATTQKSVAPVRQVGSVPAERDVADRVTPVVP